jgi:IS5 family transposase
VRARPEHPLHVIKQVFDFVKVRYRGLVKNTARIYTLCALTNLFMARKRLLRLQAV